MRKYTLASGEARKSVDLRLFSTEIEDAVHEYMPQAVVVVCAGYYTVSPTPTQGDAVRIGRKISRTALGKHCIKIPKLFCSEAIEERGGDATDDATEKRNGGHF